MIKPVKRSVMRKGLKQIRKKIPAENFCQTIREIYYNKNSNKDIMIKCRIVVAMAKDIVRKLKEYKKIAKEKNINV